MKKIILIISLLFLGCCTGPIIVEPEFSKYLDEFQREANKRGIHLGKQVSIKFKDLPTGVAGKTVYKDKTIYIDADIWNNKSETDRKIIMFHEFGHYFLNRDHNDRIIDDHCESIMRTGDFFCNCDFERYRDYYFDELFN